MLHSHINFNLAQIEKLPSPSELWKELPLQEHQKNFIASSRRQIEQILDASDPRLLLIVGPCSIHDIQSAKDYALKLRELSKQVSDNFFVLMRVYFEKPRTTVGWKGLLYDPHLNGSHDISHGLRTARQLLLELAELEIPAASEVLDPISCYYFSDLISWACIGARTSESQIHRQLASALPMPTAFKNSTTGNIEVAVHGVVTASSPHTFLGINAEGKASVIKSEGNPYGHVVLRGGDNKPNYDPDSISKSLDLLKQHRLPPRLIIDCSHDNSMRRHEQQPHVFQSVIHQFLEGEKSLRGLILESHLSAGNQPLTDNLAALKYAVSITDPCLDWDSTEQLILWAHGLLSQEKISTFPAALCRG
jgi:3-deoxy-7-phosphoheptulonate synthase